MPFLQLIQRVQRIIERPDFFSSLSFTRGKIIRFYSLLILLFTLASVAIALPASLRFSRFLLSSDWHTQESIVMSLYPDELRVHVKGGEIVTNVTEPYAIAFPEAWRGISGGTDMPENLLIIDTTKSIAADDFLIQKTWLILGKDTLGAWDQKEGKVSIYSFDSEDTRKSADALTVTKTIYDRFVIDTFSVVQKVLLVGLCLLPVFLYIVYWLWYLLYLLFGAGVVWVVVKVRGYDLSYVDAYRAGMYLLPVPLIYDFFVMLLSHFPYVRIPFLFSIFLFVMALRNFPKVDMTTQSLSDVSGVSQETSDRAKKGVEPNANDEANRSEKE